MKLPSRETLLQLKRLTARLAFVVEDNLLPLDESRLNWKAASSEWSIAECLAHIHQIAQFYQPRLQQKIQQALRSKSRPTSHFNSGWLAQHFLRDVQLDDENQPQRRRLTPNSFAPLAPIPANIVSLVLQDLRELLDLLHLSEQVSLQSIKIGLLRPRFLRLSLGNMLRYVVYHYDRHIVQAQHAQYAFDFERI